MAWLVEKRYAKALFDLGLENNKLEKLDSDIRFILSTLDTNDDFFRILTNPEVQKEEKLLMFKNVFEKSISNEIIGFFAVILHKNREEFLKEICIHFIEMVMIKNNIAKVKVKSVVPLTNTQIEKIKENLFKVTKKEILIEPEIDPSIIGGIYIEIDGKVIDGTVAKKIKDIRQNLLNHIEYA